MIRSTYYRAFARQHRRLAAKAGSSFVAQRHLEAAEMCEAAAKDELPCSFEDQTSIALQFRQIAKAHRDAAAKETLQNVRDRHIEAAERLEAMAEEAESSQVNEEHFGNPEIFPDWKDER